METQTLHTENKIAENQLASLRTQLAAAQGQDKKTEAASASTPPKPKGKEPPPGALKSYTDINVMADPELGGPVIRRHRRYAMGNYRKAIEALHLTPEDDEKLRRLVVDRWNAQMDAKDLIKRVGIETDDLVQKTLEAVTKEGDRIIKDFVGDEAYAKFEEERKVYFHTTTNWILFTALWDAGMPVSSEQQEAYGRAMQQNEQLFPTPDSRTTADPDTGLSQADLALLDAIRAFLSPEQIALIHRQKMEDSRYRSLGRLKASLKEGRKP